MATTLGIDVSIWQDNNSTPQMMDFAKAKAAGAKFVFIKASQAGYLDQDYVKNWQNADGVLPRGAYHFYDWRISYKTQIDLFCQIIGNDPGELPPVLDYEMRTGAPARATAAGIALRFLKDIENRIGKKPMLYTSPGYWDSYGVNNPEFANYPLWVAHYDVSKPAVRLPWKDWTIWQFTAKGDGLKFGAESKSLDLDYFNGTEEEFRAWAGLENPAPAPLTVEERLTALEARVKRLEEINHVYLPSVQK